DIAWATGANGTVLRTVDAGETWTRCPVPQARTTDFRDVEAFDADNAVIMGVASPARFLRTSDGGATWIDVHHDDAEEVFYDGMAFWSERRGMAFSDPVDGVLRIVVSDDAGRTWRVPTEMSIPPAREGEAGFAASGTSIAVERGGVVCIGLGGPGARLFRSTDFGRTWTATDSPLSQDQPAAGIFSLVLLPGGGGVMVGGNYERGDDARYASAWSVDGVSWTLSDRPPGGYRSAVALSRSGDGLGVIACGPNGVDWSVDGGRTWTPIHDSGFHAVRFADDGAWGWAVGADGRIARLVPAGR
ncbi:MAG: oxidoreductase, partial [Planctomycetota bacterium]